MAIVYEIEQPAQAQYLNSFVDHLPLNSGQFLRPGSEPLITIPAGQVMRSKVYADLYRQQPRHSRAQGEILPFYTEPGHDVYNITAPFDATLGGEKQRFILGRDEERGNEFSHVSRFCNLVNGVWVPNEKAPELKLQDPSYKFLDGQHVVWGVDAYKTPAGATTWRTIFYAGEDLSSLEKIAESPDYWKDICLAQDKEGVIHSIPRPYGTLTAEVNGKKIVIEGGPGRLGYVCVGSSLKDLRKETFYRTKVLKSSLPPDEWEGGTDAEFMPDGRIGVVEHRASQEVHPEYGKIRHYIGAFECIDTEQLVRSPLVITGTADDYPNCDVKPVNGSVHDLKDVLFIREIRRFTDPFGRKKAFTYGGKCDTAPVRGRIDDPYHKVIEAEAILNQSKRALVA